MPTPPAVTRCPHTPGWGLATKSRRTNPFCPPLAHEDLVFTNPIGDYIDRWNLRREVAALCKDASIFRAIAPNELRHSCASLLRHREVCNTQIADFLGHTDTRMLDKHYGHRVTPVIDLTEAQGQMLGT